MRDREASPVTTQGGTLLMGAGLSKRFRHVRALEDVDVHLEAGDVVALLGPNGAGKTTLLRILAGVSTPSAGRWEATGARVGWVPHQPAVYRKLTTQENLRLFSALEGADDPDALTADLLRRADLERFADQPAGEFSIKRL